MSPHQIPPALIIIMSGQWSSNGNLDHLTALKLRKAAEIGRIYARNSQTYFYVFPDGRTNGQHRLCDVMKVEIQKADGGQCRGVQVPEFSQHLVSHEERQDFVNRIKEVSSTRMCQYVP